MKLSIRLALLCIIAVALHGRVLAQCHHEAAATGEIEQLGELSFETSGAPAAQPHMIRGMLLLHSFEYRAAAKAFRKAQEVDPGFAMAYWGEAMTYNQTLWDEQNIVAAREVLSRVGATPEERLAKAPTAREKAYLAAIHALYGNGSKKERDAAYSAEMERLASNYPNDLEARAFYALSLLGLGGADRDVANYIRGGAIAEEAYEVNRRHPGALHYLIHAYDDPIHAPLGLRAARTYGKVAPAASHAQHMPSHIFFALAMWDESIEANVASLASARRDGALGTHPLHWLVYAYLQQGRREDAAALLRMIAGDVKEKPRMAAARAGLANACATWLIETASDAEPACNSEIDRSGTAAIAPFVEHELARGLAAVRKSDLEAARKSLANVTQLVNFGREAVSAEAAVSRLDRVSPEQLAYAEIMERQLRAAILFAEKKHDSALQLAAEAVAAERARPFEYGPPRSPKPPAEFYADLLLKAGRSEEALRHYEETLQRTPGRAIALAGAATAAERLGDEKLAAETRQRLRKQWRSSSAVLAE